MPARIPRLCRHKSTGRGYVTDPFTGREHYFRAPHGTPECQAEYDEWLKKLLDRRKHVASGTPPGSSVTVARLVLDYMTFARGYYQKHGQETKEVGVLELALRPVNDLCGTLSVDAFGPSELKTVRQWMIDAGWTRGSINNQVQRIRRVFRWGLEHGLVRAETLAGLLAVAGLRVGRTAAKEAEPIEPVDAALVEATLPRLSTRLRALVEVQLHADMRPGEAVIMRPMDIDRSALPWLYVPHTHKTEHKGRQRRIWLGPKARAILAPLILKCPREDAWLFPSRKGRGRLHLTVPGYRKAIQDACRQEPPLALWAPNQLRHTAATEIRKQFGIEAAQAVLGHAQLSTSEIYAAKNEALARDIAERIG